MMKITYDEQAKAWYMYLVDKIGDGEAVETKQFDGAKRQRVLLDFDKNGKVLGIEIV
jgi:uncharacterized protein YuzE